MLLHLIRTTVLPALVGAALVVAGAVTVAASTPCETEDATATLCHWDATERGNGQGRSFAVIGDHVVYLPTR